MNHGRSYLVHHVYYRAGIRIEETSVPFVTGEFRPIGIIRRLEIQKLEIVILFRQWLPLYLNLSSVKI